MRPSTSQNLAATTRRHSVLPRRPEIRVPAIAETRACFSVRRYCANILCRWMAQVDDGKRVSSVAPLAIGWRSNLPALFQRLADLGLSELLLLRKIFAHVAWLTIFRDKLDRFNVLRFPIEIENLVVRSEVIFRMAMAIQA